MAKPPVGSFQNVVEQLAAERRQQREQSQEGFGIDVDSTPELADPITFAEARWGLNQKLWPIQKFILKCFFRIPLDDTEPTISIREYPNEEITEVLTEKGFARYLLENGMSNVDPDEIHEAKQLLLACGRRSSKTFTSSIIICYTIYKLIKFKNPQKRFGLPEGEKITISNIASTKDQAGVLFNMVSNHLSTSPFFKRYVDKILGTSIRMYTPWDLEQSRKRPSIVIKALPCSAKSIRGSGTILAIMDEFAHFDVTGGPSSDDRVYTAFAPSIVTFGDEGRLISISSPLGESGKFYRMFHDGVQEGNKTYLAIQLPTWIMNPTIKMKTLQEMESTDPDNFYAEYGASFLAAHSRSYIPSKELLDNCVDLGRKSKLSHTGLDRYYMALDVGFSRDGFAIAVCHAKDKDIIVDYAEVFFAGIPPYENMDSLDPDEMADIVADVYKTFRPVKSCMDQFESYAFNSLLLDRKVHIERIPIDRSANSEMYQRFRNRIFQSSVRLPDDPYLRKELRTLRVNSSSKYTLAVSAPSGSHDDISDAVVRACWLCDTEYFDYKNRGKQASTRVVSLSGRGQDPRTATFLKQAARLRRNIRR